jgi:sugar lactone lactonase YvrE
MIRSVGVISFGLAAIVIGGCAQGPAVFDRTAGFSGEAPAKSVDPAAAAKHVYIGAGNRAAINVYEIGSRKLVRTISQGTLEPFALAFDARDNLYAANFGNDTITVYAKSSSTPKLTITTGIDEPTALALGKSNTLYVMNSRGNTIPVYDTANGDERYVISEGSLVPEAIAVDPSGNLYVSTFSSISVYSPNSSSPARTITDGINGALALQFDSGGNLYVANVTARNITVYAPGSTSPFETFKKDVFGPFKLGMDAKQNLYVLGGGRSKSVTVFSPSGQRIRKFTEGLGRAQSMGVAPNGTVYVGARAQVSVFRTTQQQPDFVIKGVAYVRAIAFGP